MKKWLALALAALLCLGCASAEDMGTRLRVVNCNEWITLREEADTGSTSLDRIPLGTSSVVVVDYDYGDFAQVSYAGQKGFALKKYLTAATRYEGEEISASRKERYNVNLFLSNFSEQYFAVREGCYARGSSPSEMMIDFGINHVWFNKKELLDDGNWGEYNTRVAKGDIVASIRRYLGTVPVERGSDNYKLLNGYYYWTETGGHVNDGFVCYDRLEELENDRCGVYFRVYGSGEIWDNDVCYSTPAQVHDKYWCYYEGHAVINLNGGDLSDRDGWYLEQYVVRPST